MSFAENVARFGDTLIRLHDSGVPVSEAASSLGISRGLAYKIMRAKGAGLGARSSPRPVDADLIRRVYDQTGSANLAAKAANVAFSVVRRILVADGVFKPGGPYRKPEAKRRFLELIAAGWTNVDACREVGVNERTGKDWKAGIRRTSQGRVHADGTLMAYVGSDRYKQSVRKIEEPVPDDVAGSRYLSLAERLDIADGLRAGQSLTAIAVRIGRHKSTVSREVKRHGLEGLYLPYRAQRAAKTRRARPKASKLVTNDALRQVVADGLARFRSPEQISQRLHKDYPDDEGMRVSHETIYQALYCQARGGLKRELQTCLRTGRARRKPRRSPERRTRRFPNMVMISDRPAEVGDRAVPGHWEGDLIIGKGHQSAIGTLVERSTRYTMLVHLPGGSHHAEAVRDGLIRTISTLPTHLRGSLTWDQGCEMARHHQFSMATDMAVYFCDPGSPWQRGSNENTNGLLRQYFPKGSDLSRFSPEDLEHVALQLNDRPRKTLGWDTPAERFRVLLTT